jgi:hypothetical protein
LVRAGGGLGAGRDCVSIVSIGVLKRVNGARAAVPLPKHSQVLIQTSAAPDAQLRPPPIVGERRLSEFLKDEAIFLMD